MIVSLLSYAVLFLGVVLGGFWLLMIFSLLAIAQKGDEYQDQLEFALRQRQDLAPSLVDPGKSENIGSPAKSAPDQVGVSQPGMLMSR
jgi:hypothetical protein